MSFNAKDDIYKILESVKDPEIPVLSIADLGILREIKILDNGVLSITVTPTYNGCPAMDTIKDDIKKILHDNGYTADIKTSISPAWTTDWLTEKGRKNLEDYGIAPPAEATTDKSFLMGSPKTIRCPICKSIETEMISRFGSTACKALYKCKSCLEPFDYFKCI